MIKLLVIADDLTGALDAGVHFAEKGVNTEVIPVFSNVTLNSAPDESVEVMVINTESRHIPAENAAKRVALAAGFGIDHGADFIYKKTDSTLRGNIGAELEGLMKATGTHRIPFIPAYPALSRFTRKGYHYVGDQLLHHTRFAEDPLEPIKSSYIPEILGQQTLCKIGLLSFPFDHHLSTKENNEREILVFDCSSDLDLDRIGSFLEEIQHLNIVAGSAGFAPVLARKLSFSATGVENIGDPGTCLIINGSLNPVSLEQIQALEDVALKSIHLAPEFLNSEQVYQEKWNQLLTKARDMLQDDPFLVINSSQSRKDLMKYLADRFDRSISKNVFSEAAQRLGRVIAGILETTDIGMMIIVGGDTLMALVGQLGLVTLHPIKEVLPGVVLSQVRIRNKSIYLVTKPGGYGEKDTLLRIIKSFKNQEL